jgi:hypothetical protein
MPTPREIMKGLNEYVIGQRNVKVALAVGVQRTTSAFSYRIRCSGGGEAAAVAANESKMRTDSRPCTIFGGIRMRRVWSAPCPK